MIDENIEKSLKRFLKRKISVNESVVVKFLITGLIGATLTACGGGGGGGSSSGGVTPPKPENSINVNEVFGKTEITDKKEIILVGEKTDSTISNKPAISAKNSTVTNEANLNLSGKKVTAISGVNSNIINKANITLNGEGATALKGETDTVLKNKALEISIQNNGNITLNGKNQTGILVISKNGKISGINKGTINVNGENGSGMKADGSGATIINNGNIKVSQSFIAETPDLDPRAQMSKGMYILNGSTGTNNKNIEVQGSSIGMFADGKNSTATNNGTITLNGKNPQNDDFVPTVGMASIDGGKLVNEKNGKIISNVNSSIAMYSENGTIENKGIIEMKGNDNDGIIGDNSNIINNGTIVGTGNNIVGMETSGKGFTATNNKEITLSGKDSYGMGAIEGATAKNEKGATISIKGENSFGMVAEDSGSEIINNGSIQITGNNSGGMIAEANTIAINNNDITVGGNNSFGMIAEDPDSKILNKGTITVGKDNSIAMYGYTENSVAKTEGELEKLAPTNEGKIEITGTNSIGINVHTEKRDNKDVWGFVGINNSGATINVGGSENTGMFGHNSDIMNKGNINVTGKNSVGMKTTGLSFADNKNFITITGENSTGMLAENGGRVSNEEGGTIKVTGKNSFAMKANGVGSSARNEEGGKIEVNAGNSGIIVTNGANALNDENATISIKGDNSIGMVAKDSGSNANNNGNIEITGNNSVGMLAENGGRVSNEKSGTIKVTGKNSFAMKADGASSLATNKEGAIINGGGMFATNGAEANNEGTIEIDRNLEISPDSEPVTEYLKDFSFAMKGIDKDSSIVNSLGGNINISGSTVGMYTKDGEAINNGNINIGGDIPNDGKEYKTPIGMIAEGNGIATNNGTITGSGNGDIQGMFAYNGGTVINGENGKINLKGESVTALNGLNGTVINKGEITANGHVMELSGGQGINEGTIIITTNDDSAILAEDNANVTNEKTGIIKVSGDYVIGIDASVDPEDVENGNIISGVQLVNKGTIEINSENLSNEPNENGEQHSTGIYLGTNDGTATATNSGNITMTGNNSVGIYAYNGKIENSGKISVTGNMGTGLYISGDRKTKGEAINNGEITVEGNESDGILAELRTTATNNRTITIIGNNSSGMNASQGATITNNSSGIININGTGSNGMFVANNSTATNSGTIKVTQDFIPETDNLDPRIQMSKGMYILNEGTGTNNKTIEVQGSSIGMFTDGKNANAINNGTITLNGENLQSGEFIPTIGMASIGGGKLVNETNGKIVSKINNSTAMLVENSSAINNGLIELIGNSNEGISGASNSNITNNGTITINGNDSSGIRVVEGSIATNETNATISITGDESIGMKTKDSDSKILNKGIINVDGNNSAAMYGYSKTSDKTSLEDVIKLATTNEGTIEITGTNSRGIDVSTEDRTDKNTWGAAGLNNVGATINVGGSRNAGMFGNNSDVVNYGNINVIGESSVGMMTTGLSFADNKGVITVTGENSVGMLAENGGRVTNGEEDRNVGVINVNGKGSYAMKADGFGSKALNEIGGTINVGANASGGMLATNGGTISNEGTINIDSSHKLTDNTKVGFALQTDESSTIINTGTIKADGKVEITSGTNYVLGTTKSGSYGKISAKSINLDGNVIVDSTIASVDFKDSYTLDDAISSEETKLGKDFKVLSNTMLYNATAKKDDSKNNVDVELSRNENNLVDFTSKEYNNLASVFDKGINDKEFRDKLSDEAKNVLNNVFANTTSEQNIQNRLKEISGVEYTNIARQIFDTKDIFKSYDSSIINTLDNYQFNFSFIGNYSDVEAKGNLLGYDSQMTGISGAMKFNDSLYGVIGYGYNDIDFDGKSEGNIKSVHTGIYKDMKLNSFDVRLGVFGEYNFHEVERDLTNEIAKGDFNSYLLGATGEISQRFGDSLYVKPALSLDVTYGKYEDFTEDGAEGFNLTVDSQDYTSIVPAVEVKVGKDFEMTSIYSAVKFGYEFGDMNKVQEFTFDGFGKYHLDTDNIENAQTDVKVGTAFEFNNFTFNAEVGKDFGKRDREYITAGFTYTF